MNQLRRPTALLLAGLTHALVSACGARTALNETRERADAGLDARRLDAPPIDIGLRDAPASPIDAQDAPRTPFDTGIDAPPDGCRPLAIALTPIRAEVLLVLDRSTSMGWSLTGPTGPGASRWNILSAALSAELPLYDGSSDLGLLLFPEPGGANCTLRTDPHIAPMRDGSSAVLTRLASTGPGGRTPTTEAMSTARRYFVTRLDPRRPQAVVLATDGAPNCNGTLDTRTCRCTNGAGLPVGGCAERELCLDDTRATGVIADLLTLGVPTYVIGIDGDPDPALSGVLTGLATAGGRPNPLDPVRGYYSVQRPADLSAALARIEASIARCTLTLDSPLPAGGPVVITLDGAAIPEDPSRTNGWTWTPGAEIIELHGAPCDLSQDGADHVLELARGC